MAQSDDRVENQDPIEIAGHQCYLCYHEPNGYHQVWRKGWGVIGGSWKREEAIAEATWRLEHPARTMTLDGQEIELPGDGERIVRDGMVIYDHGVIVLGDPVPDPEGRWMRTDIFVDTTGRRFCASVRCNGSVDTTPPVAHTLGLDYTGYDGEHCASCFLNIPHTHAYHDRLVYAATT